MKSHPNRQPKGTSSGGQFAVCPNPEAGLTLGSTEGLTHAAPFSVGTTLRSGVVVSPWVDGVHEENVVIQVWMREWGDGPTDCAGWEPASVADILRERGVKSARKVDLVEVLADPDILKVAFRADTTIDQLVDQINSCLKEARR